MFRKWHKSHWNFVSRWSPVIPFLYLTSNPPSQSPPYSFSDFGYLSFWCSMQQSLHHTMWHGGYCLCLPQKKPHNIPAPFTKLFQPLTQLPIHLNFSSILPFPLALEFKHPGCYISLISSVDISGFLPIPARDSREKKQLLEFHILLVPKRES